MDKAGPAAGGTARPSIVCEMSQRRSTEGAISYNRVLRLQILSRNGISSVTLALFDSAVLIAYMLLIVGMGLYFARRNTGTEEYFVGGRSFAGWVVGLSLVGTSISSVTFLAYPGDAFKTAWLRFVPNIGLLVAVALAAWLVLPIYRGIHITSAYEYLERRFGPSVRVYGAVAFLITQVLRLAIVLYLVSLLVHQITGLDMTLCILACGVFVAFYTIVGGIDAVIWTDVMQTLVLVLGGVVCLVVIVQAMPGGMGQILEIARDNNKLAVAEMGPDGAMRSVGWGLSLGEKTGTMMVLYGIVAFLTEYTANQNVVQRYAAAKSTREARKAMYVCAAASLPIWAFYMFLGTALFAYYQQFPSEGATAILAGEQKAEQVLPMFITQNLPPGMAGLVIAAAIAAAMSSLDSSINAISAVGVTDLYKRLFAADRDDRHYLWAAYTAATLAGVLMIAGAIVLHRTEARTLQHFATVVTSVCLGGLLGMYALGLFTRRGDARAVWAGIAASTLFTVWTVVVANSPESLPSFLQAPFDLYYTGIIGNVVMFVVGYAVACTLTGPPRERLDGLTVWDRS